jgi:hypothetical protein
MIPRIDSQLFGFGRRLHAVADFHEQRIAKEVSQSLERMTDRTLREIQAIGGPSDTAFAKQRIENSQEIEVELLFIMNAVHRGDRCRDYGAVGYFNRIDS